MTSYQRSQIAGKSESWRYNLIYEVQSIRHAARGLSDQFSVDSLASLENKIYLLDLNIY